MILVNLWTYSPFPSGQCSIQADASYTATAQTDNERSAIARCNLMHMISSNTHQPSSHWQNKTINTFQRIKRTLYCSVDAGALMYFSLSSFPSNHRFGAGTIATHAGRISGTNGISGISGTSGTRGVLG